MERLEFIRHHSARELPHLQETSLVPEKLTGNIEALIGSVEVPVGLAGPLLFRGRDVVGPVYAPFATTEGALVASATRGATAISRSGGVATRVLSQKMERIPLFVLSNMAGAVLLADWVRDHIDEVRERVRQVSSHANLVSLEPMLFGNMVNLSFAFETGDAAGQNMTTACTWRACQWIMDQTRCIDGICIDDFFVEGNMSADKKVSHRSLVSGRGIRVTAECFLPRDIVQQVLKVTPERLQSGYLMSVTGGLQSGAIGHSINVANTLAAIFTATGQDIASVHESAIAVLHVNQAEDGIYASVLIPSLIVGTVGGGTHIPRQNNLLEVMDCAGQGKVSRLAEIIAGFALALDLSTMAAIAGGQFVSAHERLGRNHPVAWLTETDLNRSFFCPGLRRLQSAETEITRIERLHDFPLGSSIITELSSCSLDKLVGLLPFRLHHRTGDATGATDVLVKTKPLDKEVILLASRMAAMCGGRLADEFSRCKDWISFAGCHIREPGIYREDEPRLQDHMPLIIDTVVDEKREIYAIVMELLDNVLLKDTIDDPRGWGSDEIEAALRGASLFHSVWYGKERGLLQKEWLGRTPTTDSMTQMIPLWEALGVHASREFPEWVSTEDAALHQRLVRSIPEWWRRIEGSPRTLIHNDFNPRNICLRRRNGALVLCAYDWELATLHLPQHDLAELLTFVLSPEASTDEIEHYIAFLHRALESAVGNRIDPRQWREGYRYSLYDLAVNRIPLYTMAHTFRHYGFMERVHKTLYRLIRYEQGRWPEGIA